MPANKRFKKKKKNQLINDPTMHGTSSEESGHLASPDNERSEIKITDEKNNESSGLYRSVTFEDIKKLREVEKLRKMSLSKKPEKIMSLKDKAISYLDSTIQDLEHAIKQYSLINQDNHQIIQTEKLTEKESAEKVKAELIEYRRQFIVGLTPTDDFTYQSSKNQPGNLSTKYELKTPDIYEKAQEKTLALIKLVVTENHKQANDLLEQYKKDYGAHRYHQAKSGNIFLVKGKKKAVKKSSTGKRIVRKRKKIKELPEEMRVLFYLKESIERRSADGLIDYSDHGLMDKTGQQEMLEYPVDQMISIVNHAKEWMVNGKISKKHEDSHPLTNEKMTEPDVKEMATPIVRTISHQPLAQPTVQLSPSLNPAFDSRLNPWTNPPTIASRDSWAPTLANPFDNMVSNINALNQQQDKNAVMDDDKQVRVTLANNDPIFQQPSFSPPTISPATNMPEQIPISTHHERWGDIHDDMYNNFLQRVKTEETKEKTSDHHQIPLEDRLQDPQDPIETDNKDNKKNNKNILDSLSNSFSKQKTKLFSTFSAKKLKKPQLVISHKIFPANIDKNNKKKSSFSSMPTPIPVDEKSEPCSNELKQQLKTASFSEQFNRDSNVLNTFLSAEDKNDSTYGEKQMILRRVFTMIDAVSTVTTSYEQEEDMDYKNEEVTLPIGSVLLHGSLFKVDVPYNKNEDPDALFHALIGGKENIAPFDIHGKNNGEHAMDMQVPVFHRIPSAETAISEQYYGMNLGLGEPENPLPANGHHGHLYMHWTPPNEMKPGSLVLAIKSAEPGHVNHFGELNTKRNTANEFSASGGQKFSIDPALKKIHTLRANMQPKEISSLIQKLSNEKETMKIDIKIREKIPLKISILVNQKNMIEKSTDVNEIEAELNKRQRMVHDLTNQSLNKKQSEALMHQINKCKKLLDKLDHHKKDGLLLPTQLERIRTDLQKLITIKGKVAIYDEDINETITNVTTKKLHSTYMKGTEKIDIMQTIKKQENQTVSELTSNTNALKKLAKESGNEGSKIMVLNEAIKWIEETLHIAYPANTPANQKKLMLENYDSLDEDFLKNLILYCKKCGYTCQLNPPNSTLSSFNQKEINKFNDFYDKYENVLYVVEEKKIIAPEKSTSPVSITRHVVSKESPHEETDEREGEGEGGEKREHGDADTSHDVHPH